MIKYIIKRFVIAIVTIFVVATLTFFLMNVVPGGPYEAEKAITPQAQMALEAKFGLDKPLFEQYITYMGNVCHGDFGPSLKQRGRNVSDIIVDKFPVSASLGIISVVLALLVGIPIGSFTAYKRGKFSDRIIILFTTIGISVPNFIVCVALMYFFTNKWHMLPSIGDMNWKRYILPVFALAFYPTAYIARLMRTSMLDVLNQDYMRTAKAKGLSLTVCIFKHALRNALIPVVTYVGPLLAYILTGSFVIEKIFTIPGLGREFVSAITNRDYMMIMGTTIFLATIMVFINVLVDIINKMIDSRIQLK